MKKEQIRNSLLLVLTALVWGIAFVAQSTGGDAIGPYSFNSIRSIIGSLVLIPVIFLLDRINPSGKRPKTNEEKRTLFLGGFCCGTILFLASTAQQLGIYYGTSAGKAGFLTACYILLVPVFGLFLKKKCGINIWIGIVIAIAGLYLLCMTDSISFQTSDLMVLLCAVLFALHILVVDHFSPLVDGVRMSCMWGLGLFPNGIFRYETADTFRMAVCTWQSGCMDSYFICRYFLLRCRLYAADRRAERTQSDGGIHDHESGIRIFRAGRLVDIA